MSNPTRQSGDFPERTYALAFIHYAQQPPLYAPGLLREWVTGPDVVIERLRRSFVPTGVSNRVAFKRVTWSSIMGQMRTITSRPSEPSWSQFLAVLLGIEHSEKLAGDWAVGTNNDPLHRAAEKVAEQPVVVSGVGLVAPPEERALTSMAHLYLHRAEAGTGNREHTVRKSDGTLAKVRTRSALGELVVESVLRADAAHSAANTVHGIADGHLAILGDATKTNTERETALWALRGIEDDYAGAVRTQLASLSFGSEPTDADGFRALAVEAIGIAAMRHRNFLLGTEGAQDAFDDCASTEQRTALSNLARLRQRAVRRLFRADSVGRMRAIRTKAISDMEAVEVSGSPQWAEVNPGGTTEITTGTVSRRSAFAHDAAATEPQPYLTLRAAHRARSEKIEAAITETEILQGGFSVSFSIPSASKGSQDAAVAYKGSAAPRPGPAIRFTARNDRGPSVLTLVVPDPAPAPSV